MKVPFGEVDWADHVRSPFSGKKLNDSDDGWGEGKAANTTELRAFAREFTPDRGELIYDEPDIRRQGKQKCVVVGKQRMPNITENRKHYVLIIIEVGQDGDHKIYEKVCCWLCRRSAYFTRNY